MVTAKLSRMDRLSSPPPIKLMECMAGGTKAGVGIGDSRAVPSRSHSKVSDHYCCCCCSAVVVVVMLSRSHSLVSNRCDCSHVVIILVISHTLVLLYSRRMKKKTTIIIFRKKIKANDLENKCEMRKIIDTKNNR